MVQRKATPKRTVATAKGRASANDAAPKDRRRERGEASVQRILDATIELIAEEGLASVTMQRIAEHVGSSNALVVFHFRSKENLFRAVLQYLSDQYDALWLALVRAPGLTPVERLLGAVDCAQRFARQHPKWVSVFVVFSSDRKSMQIYNEIGLPSDLAYTAEARELLVEIARDGGYGGVDIHTLSESLNYLVHGAWYWDHLNPSGRDTDVLRKTMLLLLHQAFPRHFDLLR
ncbi:MULTISPECIES: TetR/AcrR family transcriptional regulator [unclassified Mesorhizobium]|uniref:TetR/AcrR family transcriptional regulator n=1 Tax=unclassified Mesorhizobium TaxID=325217 RepID=UPI000FD724DD|nr:MULTISPECIES: TetR/AcrR family transcriptional regulator [unclassified Mesorhizobium]TGR58902.1 TetR/AcrR family transcriptional regulator [bacterium M00.F.Ca.ET.199.01.1.1]TGU41748.1 TetR/AcrR family transcriptional regulator [bacterium M00.F.Ca.ET.156.01.1.1]TGV89627.1 TetR/AcrR family transcriptional regulator [Mesorhizobium sp. M00.F.Ca.ET.149.01.1.1]TIT68357.1 MAG: TetR family transcriptional regulator [Mesorhizobium sp.]TGR32887.1 TetR/AcrR family transcriptional regulator [Mesorhizob